MYAVSGGASAPRGRAQNLAQGMLGGRVRTPPSLGQVTQFAPQYNQYAAGPMGQGGMVDEGPEVAQPGVYNPMQAPAVNPLQAIVAHTRSGQFSNMEALKARLMQLLAGARGPVS